MGGTASILRELKKTLFLFLYIGPFSKHFVKQGLCFFLFLDRKDFLESFVKQGLCFSPFRIVKISQEKLFHQIES